MFVVVVHNHIIDLAGCWGVSGYSVSGSVADGESHFLCEWVEYVSTCEVFFIKLVSECYTANASVRDCDWYHDVLLGLEDHRSASILNFIGSHHLVDIGVADYYASLIFIDSSYSVQIIAMENVITV